MYSENYKILKISQTNGKIYCAFEWEESILFKRLHYSRQSTDSVQSFSNYQMHAFHKTKTNNSKICMKLQKTPNNQNNLEKEEKIWRFHNPWFQIMLQSCSNQKSTVLAEKWIRRLMEKETATHSSVLAWRIPGTGEPAGLPSMGSHRVGSKRVQEKHLFLLSWLCQSLWLCETQ